MMDETQMIALFAERGVCMIQTAPGRYEVTSGEGEARQIAVCVTFDDAVAEAFHQWGLGVAHGALASYLDVMDALETGGLVITPSDLGPSDDDAESDRWGWRWAPTGCSGANFPSECDAITAALQHIAQHQQQRRQARRIAAHVASAA